MPSVILVNPTLRCMCRTTYLTNISIVDLFLFLGPVWLKNLYFAYLLVLRAIVKAEPYWKYYQFYTGNEEEDQLTRDQVVALVQAPK